MKSQLQIATDKLNALDVNDIWVYDETSPTFLRWKHKRVGRNGKLVERANNGVAGCISKYNLLAVNYEKSLYSIPRVVWVMFNGPMPYDKITMFKDGDSTNAKIDNLLHTDNKVELDEKYSQRLHEFLYYDENSPSFLRWKVKSSRGSTMKAGDVAGSLDDTDGYWKLHALGDHYKVHRVIWFLHYGKIPKGYHIDHINRDRADNRISNLRAVPQTINGKNRSKNSNNTTGVNGIAYGEFFNHRGTLIRRYVVTLRCNDVKFHRSFSLNKYGEKKAWELALAAKEEIVKQLKESGAGFTDDHGT